MTRAKTRSSPRLPSTSHRAPIGSLPVAQQTTELYVPKAGRKLRVIPSQRKSTEHYVVPKARAVVAPMYFHDFLVVSPLTEAELERLEGALGRTLSKDVQERMNAANHHLVCLVALNARTPPWSDFRDVLEQIKKTATQFTQLCTPETDPDPKHGSFTVKQAIALYLSLKLPNQEMQAALDAVAQLSTACDEALGDVARRASKPGNPRFKDLKAYCKQLVVAARDVGVKAALDSNETRRATPIVRFVHEALKIVCEKAVVALDASPLSDIERSDAMKKLADFASKPTSALIDHIRDARKKVKPRVRAANSPDSKPN